MKSKNQRLSEVLFLVYLIVLIWLIIFKTEFSLANINDMRNINLDPYAAPARVNGQIVYEEIYFNILAFLPFGLYLGLLFKKWNIFQHTLILLLVSTSFEVIQYVFSIGATDITDVLNNVMGGIIGLLIYHSMKWILKDSHRTQKIINIIAAVMTTLVIIILFLIKLM